MKLPGGKYPLLLTLMAVLFGFSFIASKNALQGIGVFQLIFSRYILALTLLTIILWRKRHYLYIARRDRKHFILLTLLEPVGYFILETSGVQFTTPSNVSLIVATIPVFSTIFAIIILNEKSPWLANLGVVLSIVGVYLIVSVQSESELAPHPMLGNIFTLGAAVSAGIYTVLCRRLARTYSPVTITYYQTVIATLVFFPLAVIQTMMRSETQVDWFIVLNILYLSFGCSVGAYFILNYTLSRLHSTQVAIFANLIPIITILASWMIYGELLQPLQMLGALLIVIGIYLTYFRFGKQPSEAPSEELEQKAQKTI